jgi:hypothetical protein
MLVRGWGTVPAGVGLPDGQAAMRLLGRWGVLEGSVGGGWSQPTGTLSAPYSGPAGAFGEVAAAIRLNNWLLSGAGLYQSGQLSGGAGVQYRVAPWLSLGAEGLWPGVVSSNVRLSWGRGWSAVMTGGAGIVTQAGTPQYQAAVALAYHAQPPPSPAPKPPPPAPVIEAPAPPAVVSAEDTYEPTGESAEPDEGLPYLRVTVNITGRKAEESKGRAEQVCRALEVQSGLRVECVLGTVLVTEEKTRIELKVERLISD